MKRPNHYSAALKIFEKQQDKMITHLAQAEAKAEARYQELLKRFEALVNLSQSEPFERIEEFMQEKQDILLGQVELLMQVRHEELLAGIEALMEAHQSELRQRFEGLGYETHMNRIVSLKPRDLIPADAVRAAAQLLILMTAAEEQQPKEPYKGFGESDRSESDSSAEASASQGEAEAEADSPSSIGESDASRKSGEDMEQKLIRRLTRKKPSRGKR